MRNVSRVALVVCLTSVVAPAARAQRIDTVRVGDAALRGVQVPTGTDTVDNYRLSAGERTPTATTVRTVSLERSGPEPVYRIRTLHWTPRGDTSITSMEVRAADLSLVHHRVKAPRDSMAVTVSGTHLTGWVVLPDKPASLLDRPLAGPVFPVDGQIPWLLPLLPFAAGYRATVPHFSPWEGGEFWTPAEVLGVEPVTIGARTFQCWRVDTGPLGPPGYRMVRWIDQTSRRVIQSALRGGAGATEFWSVVRHR